MGDWGSNPHGSTILSGQYYPHQLTVRHNSKSYVQLTSKRSFKMKYALIALLFLSTNALALDPPTISTGSNVVIFDTRASVQSYNVYRDGSYYDTIQADNSGRQTYSPPQSGNYCVVAYDGSTFSTCSVSGLVFVEDGGAPPTSSTVTPVAVTSSGATCVTTTVTINGTLAGSPSTVCY